MIGRRILAALAGLALLGGAMAIRSSEGSPSDGMRPYEREVRERIERYRTASPEELRRAAEDAPYDVAYEPRYEEVPTVVCAEDLGPACRGLDRIGARIVVEPSWTTLARLRDGGEADVDAWVAHQAVAELGVAATDGALVTDRAVPADARVAAVARPGEGPTATCATSSTPLTCMVEEATLVTVPNPATSVAGAAVLVALAREAGGTGPEHLATAVDVLGPAQVTAAPIAELLTVGVPPGEVALGTDAPVVVANPPYPEEDEPAPVPVAVRWARTSDSLPVALTVDPTHPQAERTLALLRSRLVVRALEEGGYLPLGDDLYLDPEGPLVDRPATPSPVTGADLEAALAAWRARDGEA